MARRRVIKKKPAETATEESQAAEGKSPAVKQVVEVVSEEKPEEIIEEIKEDAQKIEKAAEELEETLPQEAPAAETPPEPTKEREVVSELYQARGAEVTPEIIGVGASSTKSLLVWSLVVIGIALLTGGTLLVAVKGLGGVPLVAKPTPTPPAKQDLALRDTPTPALFNRPDIKVQVLNGGGISGSAGKMKAFLEEKGYTVEDVGNTEEFTFEETEILVKPGKEAFLDLIKKDLEETYTIGSTSAGLSADSPYGAQVIVGKK